MNDKLNIIMEKYTTDCSSLNNLQECIYCFDKDDPNFMKNIYCMFMNYLDFDRKNDDEYTIKNLFQKYDSKRIFSNDKRKISIFSFDKNYDEYKINNIFLAKFRYKIEDTINYINECFVCSIGTNNLRDKLLNFAYFYGFLIRPKFNLSFYEYIEGKKLSDILKDDNYDIKTTDNIFLQLLFALAYAEKKIGFTHYDLHGKNVLIKEFDKEYNIPYYDKDDNIFYIKSKYLPVIIDYELSTIKYNGKNYGNEKFIFKDTYAVYDVFYLLNIFSYYKRDENLKGLKKIFFKKEYYNQIELVELLKVTKKKFPFINCFDLTNILNEKVKLEKTEYIENDDIPFDLEDPLKNKNIEELINFLKNEKK